MTGSTRSRCNGPRRSAYASEAGAADELPRTPNRPRPAQPLPLMVVGLILLVTGAFVRVRGLGLLGGLIPGFEPDAPLLDTGTTMPAWVPYVAIASAVILGLLCLRWVLAQAECRPRGRPGAARRARPYRTPHRHRREGGLHRRGRDQPRRATRTRCHHRTTSTAVAAPHPHHRGPCRSRRAAPRHRRARAAPHTASSRDRRHARRAPGPPVLESAVPANPARASVGSCL